MTISETSAELALRVGAKRETPTKQQRSELVVVGTGIQVASQTTLVVERALRSADVVIFAVTSPLAAGWIRSLNPQARSFDYPRDGRLRRDVYQGMVDQVLSALENHSRVCAAFYGSPTLLTSPAHEAVRQARARGFSARMLPGVSSLDCLFADLGVDPGQGGCQLFEADDFLSRRLVSNSSAHLVLFQIAMIGNRRAYEPSHTGTIRDGLQALHELLRESYPADHLITGYEAATSPVELHRAEQIPLSSLPSLQVSEISSLYVPPIPRGRMS